MRRAALVLVLALAAAGAPTRAGAATVTTKEIEEALTCQCGCGLTVHSCNHLQCGSGIPLKQEVQLLVSRGLGRDEILLHFRDNEVLDSLLSYLLVSDSVKDFVVRLIWNPLQCIAAVAGSVFALLIFVAGMVHALRLFVRVRLYAFHAYTVTMWSTGPFLVLVPVGMVLYRVLDSSMYVLPVFVLLAVLAFWVLVRMLKGVSIIADVRPVKVYATGFLVVASLAAVIYVYYDYTQAVPMYLAFVHSTMINSQ